jgi:NADPH:quinone reductase-like Zn-dependent oxidoreductase
MLTQQAQSQQAQSQQAQTQQAQTQQAQTQASPSMMRALLQSGWGGPEVLTLGEAPVPAITKDGVRIRVVAAAVHKGDWHLLTGTPYLIRVAGYGLLKPTEPVPGMAVAGRVEAVGGKVVDFKAGDEVFGECVRGGFADFAVLPAKHLAIKPPELSFEAAAALVVSATTALQGLRDAGKLEARQSVLINGASGGVGTYAVQIAKAMGATVTAVCSAKNAELVRSLGADHVIDYAKEDFTKGDVRHDVIFDLIGNQPLSACRSVLKEKGRFVACAGGSDHLWSGPLVPMLTGLASNLFSSQPFVPLMAVPTRESLDAVAAMVVAGTVRPVIDRRLPLGDVALAMAELGTGHARGKTIITL